MFGEQPGQRAFTATYPAGEPDTEHHG